MELEERLRLWLLRYQLQLLYGPRSRCRKSISCYSPDSRRVSINADLFGEEAYEAALYQIAMIILMANGKCMRIRKRAAKEANQRRAWRLAAKMAIPDDALALGRRLGWDDEDFIAFYGITARLWEARKELWRLKLGAAFTGIAREFDRTTRVRPSTFWCDIAQPFF